MLFKKAIKKIDKDNDILSFIKCIKDLEKMKKILLNENQLKLFNLIKKLPFQNIENINNGEKVECDF